MLKICCVIVFLCVLALKTSDAFLGYNRAMDIRHSYDSKLYLFGNAPEPAKNNNPAKKDGGMFGGVGTVLQPYTCY